MMAACTMLGCSAGLPLLLLLLLLLLLRRQEVHLRQLQPPASAMQCWLQTAPQEGICCPGMLLPHSRCCQQCHHSTCRWWLGSLISPGPWCSSSG
jgi:hypothetical protein